MKLVNEMIQLERVDFAPFQAIEVTPKVGQRTAQIAIVRVGLAQLAQAGPGLAQHPLGVLRETQQLARRGGAAQTHDDGAIGMSMRWNGAYRNTSLVGCR